MTNIIMNMMNNPREGMIILLIILAYILAFSVSMILISRIYLISINKKNALMDKLKVDPDENIFWSKNDSGNTELAKVNAVLDWKSDCSYLYNLIEYETKRRFFYTVDMKERSAASEFNITNKMIDDIHDHLIKKIYYALSPMYRSQLSKYMTDFALRNHMSSKISDVLEELRVIKENEMLNYSNTTGSEDHKQMSNSLNKFTSEKYKKVSILRNI